MRVHHDRILVEIKTGGIFSDRLVVVLRVLWCHRVVLGSGEKSCTWLVIREGRLCRIFDSLCTALGG